MHPITYHRLGCRIAQHMAAKTMPVDAARNIVARPDVANTLPVQLRAVAWQTLLGARAKQTALNNPDHQKVRAGQ